MSLYGNDGKIITNLELIQYGIDHAWTTGVVVQGQKLAAVSRNRNFNLFPAFLFTGECLQLVMHLNLTYANDT